MINVSVTYLTIFLNMTSITAKLKKIIVASLFAPLLFITSNTFAQGITGPQIVCASTSYGYSVTTGSGGSGGIGAGTIKWYLNGGFLRVIGNQPSITVTIPAVGTTHELSVVYTPTIGESETYYLTLNTFQAGTISANQSIVCVGSTVNLTHTNQYGNNFAWEKRSLSGGWSTVGWSSSTLSQQVFEPTIFRVALTTDACGILYSNEVTVNVYSPLNPGSIAGAQTICYNTTPSALSNVSNASGSNGSYTYQWQHYNGSAWININGATGLSYAPGLLTSTTNFRRLAITACTNVPSNTITVTVYPDLNPGSIGNTQTICYASNAAAFSSVANPSGGNGSYAYQWQVRSPGGSWSDLSGATTATYQHGVLYSTTEFRRMVSSCGQTKESNILTITVLPDLSAGTIGGTQTICYAADVVAFTNTANATGGNDSYTYQWQSRPLGGSWSDISGATASTYDHGTLTTSMEYKRMVYSCGQSKESNIITVTVNPALSPGSIGGTQTICYNADVAPLTSLNNATGGNGIYSYQWYIRIPGGSWSAISGALGNTYDHGTLNTSMEFKRVVSSCNQTLESNTILVTVNPDLYPGTIGGTKVICSGTDVNPFTSTANPSGGTTSYTYQWQSRLPEAAWSNIAGATSATYDHGILLTTTEFKRLVSSCGQLKESNTVIVTTSAATVGGSLSPDGVETYGIASGSVSLSGHIGAIQKWQQKVGNGAWADISNTATTLAYSNVNTTTQYRAVVKSGACPELNSTATGVVIYDVPSISIQGNASIPAGGSTSIVSSANLYSYQWYRNNQEMPGETASTLTVTKPGLYKVAAKASATSPIYTTGEAEIRTNNTTPLVDMNYVMSFSFNKEGINEQSDLYDLTTADYTQSTTYFDGLGRPVQTVALGAAANGSDLITPVEYDDFGREAKKYLPYAHTSRDGRYQPTALTSQSIFYNNSADKVADDVAPYSQTIFEYSPLNRIIKQGAPGLAWQPDEVASYTSTDHTVKFSYEFNQPSEVLQWTFTYPTEEYTTTALNAFGKVEAGTAAAPVFYPANQLYKNKTKDEQGNQVIEYVDKEGRTILKRVQVATGNPSTTDANRDTNWASTYYIYDDFGNLVCEIQPEGVKRIAEYFAASDSDKEKFLNNWALRYKYDGRRRMVAKQIPGGALLYVVFDNRDRVVMTQDCNQRAENKWSFTKYDALNRPIINGIYTHSDSINQAQMSALISATNFYDSYNGNTSFHGYSNTVFPMTNADSSPLEILSVTYYDNYQFRNDLAGSNYNYVADDLTEQDTAAFNRVVGLVTGTKTNVLGTSDFLWSVNYYDDKYRDIQLIAQNRKGGFDRITNTVDFAGNVLQTKTTSSNGTTTHAIKKRYEYDHAGRLLKTYHQLDSEPEILLSATV